MTDHHDYISKTSIYIAGHGTYTSDTDLYNEALHLRTRPDLYQEVREVTEGMGITGYSKLRKFELAAMVAEWATGSRREARATEEREAASLAEAVTIANARSDAEDVVAAAEVDAYIEAAERRAAAGADLSVQARIDALYQSMHPAPAPVVLAMDVHFADGTSSSARFESGDICLLEQVVRGWAGNETIVTVTMRAPVPIGLDNSTIDPATWVPGPVTPKTVAAKIVDLVTAHFPIDGRNNDRPYLGDVRRTARKILESVFWSDYQNAETSKAHDAVEARWLAVSDELSTQLAKAGFYPNR